MMRTRIGTVAHAVPIASVLSTNFLSIVNEEGLRDHLNIATHVEGFSSAISVLFVKLPNAKGSILLTLRALLMRLPNIDTLCIDIRDLSDAKCLRLFKRLSLHNLSCFKTDTLPHKGILPFISRHLRLVAITVGRCGFDCGCAFSPPFQHYNLEEIRGPSKCISALVQPQTHRVFASLDTGADHNTLFQRVVSSGASIRLATLDLLPSDRTIMTRIATAMPSISTLRLEEISPNTWLPEQYPWADILAWNTGLHSMKQLKRLYLRTSSALIPTPGRTSEEKGLIMQWTRGATSKSLEEITLSYGSGLPTGDSYISTWARVDGKWIQNECAKNN